MANTFKYSYKIDMSLFMLYNYLVMIDESLLLPKKYSIKLKNIQRELEEKVFKKPKVNFPLAIVKTEFTITDTLKQDIVKKQQSIVDKCIEH